MTLIDSHCHLDFPDFDGDRADVLARAQAAGVGYALTIATQIQTFPRVLATAEASPMLFCTVGIHPCHVQEGTWSAEEIIQKTQHPKVIGIGETGLDYYHSRDYIALQQKSFRAHVQAAQETQLPVIIHVREAEADTLAILTETQAQKPYPALIHCFTASAEFGEAVLRLGLYISFSGILTFKSARDLQAIARTLPLDRILVETDAPYLAPVPHRGGRAEPAFVKNTADFLADLRDMPREDLYTATTQNFGRLFGKAMIF
jgi:TatD DNase family protein